jgi:hypothetical protein
MLKKALVPENGFENKRFDGFIRFDSFRPLPPNFRGVVE